MGIQLGKVSHEVLVYVDVVVAGGLMKNKECAMGSLGEEPNGKGQPLQFYKSEAKLDAFSFVNL